MKINWMHFKLSLQEVIGEDTNDGLRIATTAQPRPVFPLAEIRCDNLKC